MSTISVTDSDACPCSGANLDRVMRAAVLVCLATEPMHGYQVMQALDDLLLFRNAPPDPAGVYRCLRDLERDGLVTSSADAGARGREKRTLTITADGRDCLRRWNESLRRYRAGLDDLLKHIDALTPRSRKPTCSCSASSMKPVARS